MKLWIFLGDTTKLNYFGGHLYLYQGLFRSMYRIGLFLGVAKFQICFGYARCSRFFLFIFFFFFGGGGGGG